MEHDTAEDFLSVLDFICPHCQDSPGKNMAEKISYCMQQENNPAIFQSLWLLLNLELNVPMYLYKGVMFKDEPYKPFCQADENQVLSSAKNYRNGGRIMINKREFYVY